MDESSQKTNVESLMELIAESTVRNSIGNYGNVDENLCSIQPRGNNDQYDSDMNNLNTIGTHREARNKMWGRGSHRATGKR